MKVHFYKIQAFVSSVQEYVNALSNLLPSGHVQLSETAAQAVTRLAMEAVSAALALLQLYARKHTIQYGIFIHTPGHGRGPLLSSSSFISEICYTQ